ncbi:sigma-54-dependent Fis family transcriptional regulator [Mariniblastus sp.]|nr:sigma-54-dependent Fis family transcriptional regulator [Mariniblastus sp.]MDB4756731.1 sigma-54-dependent Fis family transcriptional regulator [Mariniblastus sp.]
MPYESPVTKLSERIGQDPRLSGLLPEALALITDSNQEFGIVLSQVTKLIAANLGLNRLDIAVGMRGRWQSLTDLDGQHRLPETLLGEVLDQGMAIADGTLLGSPLFLTASSNEVVFAEISPDDGGMTANQFDSIAASVGLVYFLGRQQRRQQRRIRYQHAILEIAAQWNQAQEVAPLLEQIAEAATRLLGAERASIFLWDKPNKILIGRPALGVENNELRIPDTTGIVGQVVQDGEVRRVDSDVKEQQMEIDRQVDQQLGFETRSLLCAPMISHGKILGAFEMINKVGGNFDPDDEADLLELAGHAAIALANTQHIEELLKKQETLVNQAAAEVEMIGECPAISDLRTTIAKVAPTDLSVLILGENGTGKEVTGQMVHYLSQRRNEPLVAVNCAAITESLLESELFGHEKGAFTDANETRPGKFEVAAGGTLFLDEIGDMSLTGQSKLLRVLEEKMVVRVGGSTPIPADVRIVAATNQDLAELVREKKFREDLFFRLTVVTVDMPPLRKRDKDILLLAQHFLATFCQQAKRKVPAFTAAARTKLLMHPWPGNVRELRNMMERLAYLGSEQTVEGDDLDFIMTGPSKSGNEFQLDLNLSDASRNFQIAFIEKQIEAARGNITAAAKRLGLHRSNLYRKMRQLEMEVNEEI